MNLDKDICFVIPCYNEGNRLPLSEFFSFMKEYPSNTICFVNDGSTDDTLEILNQIKSQNQECIHILSNTENIGKAESVRKGILYCSNNINYSYIAYLDADLSTPFKECIRLSGYIKEDIEFCFGSRIMIIGAKIERKYSRHFAGRIIAAFISNILELKVYDTQCGCKVFTKELSLLLFEEPFISRWLFDVELFARKINLYGKDQALKKMLEIPLKKWINKNDSKVKIKYFFQLWIDLFLIRKKYKIRKLKKSSKH